MRYLWWDVLVDSMQAFWNDPLLIRISSTVLELLRCPRIQLLAVWQEPYSLEMNSLLRRTFPTSFQIILYPRI
jgi:hypothetical protein